MRCQGPPSTTGLYKNVRTGRAATADYKAWLTTAGWELRRQRPKPYDVGVRVHIRLHCPHNVPYDIDNRAKAVLDLLVKHDVIPDDSNKWVRSLHLEAVKDGPECVITLEAA